PVSNWNAAPAAAGPYEDLDWFLNDAGSLAESLLEQGITGMKIWPFDPYAEATGGQSISLEDLRRGIEPFRKVREAVGDRIELMVELHSLWNLPSAVRIARALEEYEPPGSRTRSRWTISTRSRGSRSRRGCRRRRARRSARGGRFASSSNALRSAASS